MKKKVKVGLIISISALIVAIAVAVGFIIGKKENNEKNIEQEKTQASEEKYDSSKEDSKKNDLKKAEVKIGDEEQKILAGEIKVYKTKDVAEGGDVVKLDLNLDGKKENIWLGPIDYSGDEETLEIRVNKSSIIYESIAIEPEIVAFTMDGKKIIIGVHANGMSDDPTSNLYTYDGKKIINAGNFPNDISTANIDGDKSSVLIEGTVLSCFSHKGMLSNFIISNFDWKDNKLVEREQDEFEYANPNEELVLKRSIMVYEKSNTASNSKELKKGIVHPIKMGKDNWNYIKAEDGTEGWIMINMDEYFDIFENMNLAG